MSPTRIAGILYIAMSIPAVFALQYVPRALIVRGDATATADNLRGSELLLRASIGAELLSATLFIFTALAVYRIFESVDRGLALTTVILVIASVPISFIGVLTETGALSLLSGADYLSVIPAAQRDATALLLMRVHGQTLALAQIFWGLWLVPPALLVLKSGFAPGVVAYGLFAAATGYVGDSFIVLVAPALAGIENLVVLLFVGELGFPIWLLFSRSRALSIARPGGQPVAASS